MYHLHPLAKVDSQMFMGLKIEQIFHRAFAIDLPSAVSKLSRVDGNFSLVYPFQGTFPG